VYDQAAADMQSIIEDENEAGKTYTLVDDAGEYHVTGTHSDIGNLLDPITGEAIQGRAIEATVPAQSILTAAGKIPVRGWKARMRGKDGQEITLFVKRNEYDRTIGLCRLTLGLHLEDGENGY
jgi:hypothetical protein